LPSFAILPANLDALSLPYLLPTFLQALMPATWTHWAT
jgi:hypothetical protein